jgi:hypothetical protein
MNGYRNLLVEPCNCQESRSQIHLQHISILISLNPACINGSFRASASAKAKGPGAPGGRTGASISFLTVGKAKSISGTFEGADHTVAEKAK